MDWTSILNIIGLLFGFSGAILLAISLIRVIKMIVLAIKAHEESIQTLASTGSIIVYGGFDKQLERAQRHCKTRMIPGFILLVTSFVFQLLGLLF